MPGISVHVPAIFAQSIWAFKQAKKPQENLRINIIIGGLMLYLLFHAIRFLSNASLRETDTAICCKMQNSDALYSSA